MALNIKNEEAERLVAEVAALTGTTKTQAIIDALKDKIKAEQSKSNNRKAEALACIARASAIIKKTGPIDIDDFLYDERGLPK